VNNAAFPGTMIKHRAAIALLAGALAFLAGCSVPSSLAEPRAPEPRRAADMLRGGELYRTYCIACHTAQVHWR
jgi:mono/diheme cytochrome c family protein